MRPLAASVGGANEKKYGVYPNSGGHLSAIDEFGGSVFFYLAAGRGFAASVFSFSGCVYFKFFY